MEQSKVAMSELRAMSAAWRSLAERWDLSPAECRVLLPEGGYDNEGPPADTEHRMRLLIKIGQRLCLPDGLLQEWLRTGMYTLEGSSPLQVMAGSLAQLRSFRRLAEMGWAS